MSWKIFIELLVATVNPKNSSTMCPCAVKKIEILDHKYKRCKSVLMPVGNSKRPEGAPSPPPTFAFLARLIGFKEVELNRLFHSMLLSNKSTMPK